MVWVVTRPSVSGGASKRWRQVTVAAGLLAPSAVVLGLFVLYPLGRAVHLGTQRCDIQGRNCVSNGWDQYWDVFRSLEFQRALWVTVRFALLTVPTGIALGVGPLP